MKKVERLDTATAPDGTILSLYRHDGAYTIRVDGVELMSTRRHHSEEQLAERVCVPLQDTHDAQVLIGGLGMGFTVRTALRLLPADARLVVAEIVDKVIRWNRNPEYNWTEGALEDPRVQLRHGDVVDVLRTHAGRFDAIMLDVDNGAEPLTTSGNARLYTREGIAIASAALRAGGRLAYWSAQSDVVFERALRLAGLSVEVSRARAHATAGRWHSLIVAQRT